MASVSRVSANNTDSKHFVSTGPNHFKIFKSKSPVSQLEMEIKVRKQSS